MTQLPVTPANLPVDASGTATNSAIQAASTTKEPSARTSRMVSTNVPGWLAPWSAAVPADELVPIRAGEHKGGAGTEFTGDGPVGLRDG